MEEAILKPSTLWTIGVCLVVIGVAAHWFGWPALLWFPRSVLEGLEWAPAALLEAIAASPTTVGLIALGIVLMVAARIWTGRKG
ncbi:hypothetical protein [Roseococcus sp.]|uniref:hypothetical protein n=1 Tax=Roseococcus sp. TaxID=2109646 RepID=UPI003BA8D694